MPRAPRRVHLPIFFQPIFFQDTFFCATCSLQLDLDIDACRGLQAPHRFSGGFGGQRKTKSYFPNYSLIPFKTYVNTKDFVKTNHYCKIFNWLLDCSLKQPQAASMEFGSDRKTSRILMPNKSLIAIYYCGFLIGF